MTAEILAGDVLEKLRELPSESVHCVITSPPYYSLRCYGVEGQIGLEATPEAHLEKLVEVFREVRRVLRRDSVLCVNYGDAYAAQPSGPPGKFARGEAGDGAYQRRYQRMIGDGEDPGVLRGSLGGYKPKDLMGMPFRLALALQADGWWWRSCMPWVKKNCMPECLVPETQVFIKDQRGIRRVTLDDVLETGEPYPLILTPTGWRPILAAWETVKEDAIAFDVGKVSSVVCSREHLWPVSHDRRRGAIHELPAEQLRDTGYRDYLLHHTIEEWLDGTKREVFGQQLDYDLGWLVGLYAAEGGFGDACGHRCKLTMHLKEAGLIEKVKALVDSRLGCRVSSRVEGNAISLRFSSAAWHRIAAAFVSGKSTTKALDVNLILNSPRRFRQGIWEGYTAGDGYSRENELMARSASRELRDGMAVVASSIGLITSKCASRSTDPRTGKSFASYIVSTPYAAKRQHKAGTAAKQLTIRNKRVIEGPVRMIDLTVEGGLFLIDDGLVTHNSASDRPSTALEYVMLFAKSERYFWDQEAVRRPHVRTWEANNGGTFGPVTANGGKSRVLGGTYEHKGEYPLPNPNGRNLRNSDFYFDSLDEAISQARAELAHLEHLRERGGLLLDEEGEPLALDVNTEACRESHFAAFPRKLVQPLVQAGTSERGCCAGCGAPWVRVTERKHYGALGPDPNRAAEVGMTRNKLGGQKKYEEYQAPQTLGWRKSCRCETDQSEPCTVLDPFAGTGTTLFVALELGRRAIGIELNERYTKMAQRRLRRAQLPLDLAAD